MSTKKLESLVRRSGVTEDFFFVETEGRSIDIWFETVSKEASLQELSLWVLNLVAAWDDFLPSTAEASLRFAGGQLILLRLQEGILGLVLPTESRELEAINAFKAHFNAAAAQDPSLGPKLAVSRSHTPPMVRLSPSRAPMKGDTSAKSRGLVVDGPVVVRRGSGGIAGWWVAALLGLLLIGGGLAFWWTSQQGDSGHRPDVEVGAAAGVPGSGEVGSPGSSAGVRAESTPVPSGVPHGVDSLSSAPLRALHATLEGLGEVDWVEIPSATLASLRMRLLTGELRLSEGDHIGGQAILREAAAELSDLLLRGWGEYEKALARSWGFESPEGLRTPSLETIRELVAQGGSAASQGDPLSTLSALLMARSEVPSWKQELIPHIRVLAEEAAARSDIESAKVYYRSLMRLGAEDQQAIEFLLHYGTSAGRLVTNSVGMRLAFIPPGRFIQGTPNSELLRDPDEGQREVFISRGFLLGTTEVTQSQWERVMGSAQSHISNYIRRGEPHLGAHLPMHSVSWTDAMEFCRRISRMEGRTYRLPTEAEWEYAARAGTKTAFNTGRDRLSSREANVSDAGSAFSGPLAVGTVGRPNDWGLSDMHGNLWEWCFDWSAPYESGPVTDPKGPSDDDIGRPDLALKILRGGSWYDEADKARSGNRWAYTGSVGTSYIGFRVVRELALEDFEQLQP